MLLMKKAFFDAIRSGRKATTVRFWKHQMVRAGEVHTMPGLGKVRIDDVRKIALSELTDDDAVADGFESAAELIAALPATTLPPAGLAIATCTGPARTSA